MGVYGVCKYVVLNELNGYLYYCDIVVSVFNCFNKLPPILITYPVTIPLK